MSKTIFFLVKIFKEEQHALDFLNGKLYSNRLSFFRELEETQESNRGDINEGVVSWLQPDQGVFTINGRILTDLTKPVSVKMNWHDHLNVFCIYAGHSGKFEKLTLENISEFKKHLEIPKECLNLGNHAVVITSFTEFIKRVKTATGIHNYGLNAGLVDYYNPDIFHGSFNEHESVFKKHEEYSHQKEYRFVFDIGIKGKEAIIVDIGDISDIAMKCNSADFNKLLEVNLNTKKIHGKGIKYN